jgi:hypothetical protein
MQPAPWLAFWPGCILLQHYQHYLNQRKTARQGTNGAQSPAQLYTSGPQPDGQNPKHRNHGHCKENLDLVTFFLVPYV